MNCQNPTCGKPVPPGRRYCGERCSNAARQRNFRKRNAGTPKSNGAVTPPENILSPVATSDTGRFDNGNGQNHKNLAHPSTYKGKPGQSHLTPGWLDAEPLANANPTLADHLAAQAAQAEADHLAVVAEVNAFFTRDWEGIKDAISQVQILRSFAGVPSYKIQKETKSFLESLGRTYHPRPLTAKGREIEKLLPHFTCPHNVSWREPCEFCDAGITYEAVNDWTVREWRDRFGHICGQSKDANAALSKMGMSRWAETNRNEKPTGSTASGGRLDAIDQASQRDKKIGGKRKKPEGIGPDSYEGKHTSVEKEYVAPEEKQESQELQQYDRKEINDPGENSEREPATRSTAIREGEPAHQS
jgi:hypothetical protein